jgi:hypothetical protein
MLFANEDRMNKSLIAGTLLAAWVGTCPAETIFKCKDAHGDVTYSNIGCDKQGLKDGGVVAERTSTLPAIPTGAAKMPPPARDAKAGSAGGENEPESKGSAQVKPVNPLVERLLK